MEKIICKICSHNTKTIKDEQFATNYYLCTNCDHIFMGEKKIILPEKEKQEYLRHNNTTENEGYVAMFRDFIEKCIDPYQDKIKTALDFGCGPGPVLAELLKEKGFEVDIYDKYFALEKIFENKKYDLITSTEVLEHLADPLETLKTLKKHLNKQGIIAIMTLFHPKNKEEFKKWWYRRDLTHISFYTPKTFEILAEMVEMKVLKVGNKNTCVLGML